MPRIVKHVRRELTADERKRTQETRRWAEENKSDIQRKAKASKRQMDAARAALHNAVELLKVERLRQGLSLADIQQRTGMERPNLSRLENESEANPTIATLIRYAEALGKRVLIVLDDLPSPQHPAQV